MTIDPDKRRQARAERRQTKAQPTRRTSTHASEALTLEPMRNLAATVTGPEPITPEPFSPTQTEALTAGQTALPETPKATEIPPTPMAQLPQQIPLDLGDLTKVIDALSADDRTALVQMTQQILAQPFISSVGPQTNALHSEADLLLYGGAAGGGKSALEVGCMALEHREGIVFRREATQLDGLIEFSHEVLGEIGDYNKVEKLWVFERPGQPTPDKPDPKPERCRLKFAGLPQELDWRKHAGVARDYMAFDEAGEFTRSQVFSLLAWLRTTTEGQRTRVILGSNPPRGGEGEWMMQEFAPWLQPKHPFAAAPGELRWAIVVGNETEWVDGPGVYVRNGEEYEALSRTFIKAQLDDNPYLRNTQYRAQLQSLPEPLRSQLLYGSFTAGRDDHEWQVIPSHWITQAQERWVDRPEAGKLMTATAADMVQGGNDKFQVQSRYDDWFSRFLSKKGQEIPDGPTAAAEIVKVMRDRCRVVLDAGGGYAGDALTQLAHADIDCFAFDGSRSASGKSRDGLFTFRNFRAQAVWLLREALDPAFNSTIMLPPDPELYADLTAYRYEVKGTRKAGGEITVGPKEEMRERLGRSPDKGDTTIMLHVSHSGVLKRPKAAQDRQSRKPTQLKAITSSKTKMDPRGKRRKKFKRKDHDHVETVRPGHSRAGRSRTSPR